MKCSLIEIWKNEPPRFVHCARLDYQHLITSNSMNIKINMINNIDSLLRSAMDVRVGL